MTLEKCGQIAGAMQTQFIVPVWCVFSDRHLFDDAGSWTGRGGWKCTVHLNERAAREDYTQRGNEGRNARLCPPERIP